MMERFPGFRPTNQSSTLRYSWATDPHLCRGGRNVENPLAKVMRWWNRAPPWSQRGEKIKRLSLSQCRHDMSHWYCATSSEAPSVLSGVSVLPHSAQLPNLLGELECPGPKASGSTGFQRVIRLMTCSRRRRRGAAALPSHATQAPVYWQNRQSSLEGRFHSRLVTEEAVWFWQVGENLAAHMHNPNNRLLRNIKIFWRTISRSSQDYYFYCSFQQDCCGYSSWFK